MKLTLKKRTYNGKSIGGYSTKVNGRTYNITKRGACWEVYACAMDHEMNGRTISTGCKSLGLAESAIIESVGHIDRETSWVKAA